MLALSSTSDTPEQRGVIELTAAVIFLGTPHRGSPELSAIGEWARSLLCSLRFQTTSTILDTLGLKTTDLERAHEAFCRLWYQYDFQVKTFQESLGLTGIDLGVLGNKVVPHESSLIGDPREHAETLQANHKQMSRFSSPQDPNFIKVAGEIKAFYTAIENAHAGKPFPAKMKPGNGTDFCCEECLTEDMYQNLLRRDQKVLDELLAALRFDAMNARREAILAPATNTGNWLFRDPTFHLWTTTAYQSQRLLFMKGKPGAGKSTLMKETVRHMQYVQRRDGSGICANFFIDASGELLQRCPAGIFRSLLYQLLSQSTLCSKVTHMNPQRDILIDYIRDIVTFTLPARELNERVLQSLLGLTLSYLASIGTPVLVFVDALDELSVEMQRQQVDFWSLQQLYFQGLRICLSCRHFPNIAVAGCLELAVDICNDKDILCYITQRLCSRISASEDHWRQKLTTRIHALSSGVFLWVVLVVESILPGYDEGTSLPGLIRRVEKMPPELEKLYEGLLNFGAESEDPLMIGRMFQWVLATNRPLRLDEWHHILAFIQPSRPASLSKWRESESYTENDYQLERKIKNLSRGLLEVSSKQHDALGEKIHEMSSINASAGSLDHGAGSARVVRVIHKSVYDYFIHKGGFRNLGLDSVEPLADCHCTIVNTCIDYLFIPELNEYVSARQRAAMESLTSASLYSEKSFKTEESPKGDAHGVERGSRHFFEDLESLRPWESSEAVENWLAGWTLSTYTGSITSSSKHSVSHESLAAATSQVLDDYPALLVYAITEFMLHIEFAHLDLNRTKQTQDLITRLRDGGIWKRLRPLQHEKRARKRTTEWLEAVAQNRLPSLSKLVYALL
ncbi:Uncharacterized protein LW93_6116 [Fusarium fujikuroi]|nr:Uncharacterized protein LW93_6116 [Fusarium fujikuroi]